MSDFSAAWLALREPADRAARNAAVLEACRAALAAREPLSICDLGAGSGAMLRALAPLWPARQRWLLVDRAPQALPRPPEPVTLLWLRHDLAARPDCWPQRCDLVTASALFDLTSAAWIERLAGALAAARLPLLATLTYDGAMRFDPADPLDAAVVSAFNRHQQNDKGFGPAAGPAATRLLVKALRRAGYRLTRGASPWRLGPATAPLRAAFLEGLVAAVGETGLLPEKALRDWAAARGADETGITVGHQDLFALPP